MSKETATQKPNFIIILCDDLGYGDLTCYGSTLHRTPRLDAMAAEGVRFTDFYVASPVCSPSRAALLTGCYPQRVGLGTGESYAVLFPGDPKGLNPDEITIATLLKQQGYATKIVGKWHVGDQPPFLPARHGFDEYFGLPYSNDMGANEKRPMYPPLPLMRGERVVETEPDQASLTERYTQEATTFIREHKDEPFFLYFPHMYVHAPLHAPKAFLERSQNGPYGAEVECIDWSTGVVLDTLKELGLDERTLVIFTSDNGASHRFGGSNQPLRGWKAETWDGGMRMPLIARWPGTVPAGRTCSEIATAMDLLPTLAHLAGAEAPGDRTIDGKDIGPLLKGEPDAASDYEAFFYYWEDELRAVRSGRWKLHFDQDLLFDLEADVGETQNLFDTHPQTVKKLQALADACRQDLGDTARGIEGKNRRPPGRVADPKPLIMLDPDDPHVEAAYD